MIKKEDMVKKENVRGLRNLGRLTIMGDESPRPKSPSAFVGRLEISVAVGPLLLILLEKKRFFSFSLVVSFAESVCENARESLRRRKARE